MASWGVAQAKAKFSEVLDKAKSEGPQLVRRRSEEFVLMTLEESIKSSGRAPVLEDGKTSGQRLWESLLCPPEDGIDVEFPRMTGELRKVDF
jgi:antitoxin Phd